MAWNQITLLTNQTLAERISDYLNELGALSVTLQEGGQDRVFEPLPGETPLWNDTQVLGLFEQDLSIDLIVNLLSKKFGDELPPVKTEVIEDQDWERVWLDEFKPMRFGKRLWIIPSTYQPVDETAVNIFLDPGLAFGTGTHATTAMCLTWLDAHDLRGKTCIDYGCGSGILAIAAAKLGAELVECIDIDPQAIEATLSNSQHNDVSAQIKTCLPDQFEPKSVNILLANILAKPLINFAKQFSQYLTSGNLIVLSGILEEQAADVLEAYRPWFSMDRSDSQDGWVLLTGVRN